MLLAIASIGFFIWVVRNTFFWVGLWQLKEYRLDRVRIHLFETLQGRALLFSPLSLVKWAGVLLFGVVIFNDNLIVPYQVFVVGIYAYSAYRVFKEYRLKLLKRPKLTIKAIVMCALTFSGVWLFYFLPIIDIFTWLLIIDRLVFVLSFVFVLALSVPTEFYRDYVIEKAVKKLREYKTAKNSQLSVIGITGSYGKSSTKDYTAQILEAKFRVVKTQGTNNTPIGIANTILSDLKKSTQLFIVEMGAYKIGEIAQMCKMVHPTIGVLTSVNYQHVSLFGSIENTQKAKYEIIENLPKDGLALFNGNNPIAKKLFVTTKIKKALYSVSPELGDVSNIVAEGVRVATNHITFTVVVGGKSLLLTAPLLGAHNIENILPGIYIGKYLGMTDNQIKNAVAGLRPLSKTMVYSNISGKHVIDDTFNANPQAVLAALEYMKIYKKRKIFVMQPMIELGDNAEIEHRDVGEAIATICDYLLVTNKNFYSSIVEGVKKSGKNCKVLVGDSSFLASSLSAIADKGDVILFEGKEAQFVLDRLA